MGAGLQYWIRELEFPIVDISIMMHCCCPQTSFYVFVIHKYFNKPLIILKYNVFKLIMNLKNNFLPKM
jgi:hypothetical protein